MELHRRPPWLRSLGGATPISGHPSHASWPHKELHRGPRRLRSHGGTAPIFGTPLTRFVAP
eukprot:7771442-Pyramimonas_sp.AAC.1